MIKNSKIVKDFMQDFAIEKGLNPDHLISIKIDAKYGVTYEYLDQELGGFHQVQDFPNV
jgi:hypothetical protein